MLQFLHENAKNVKTDGAGGSDMQNKTPNTFQVLSKSNTWQYLISQITKIKIII
jgi:hypothetical protein